jgi:hypothetical protein
MMLIVVKDSSVLDPQAALGIPLHECFVLDLPSSLHVFIPLHED